jgi:quercetin dioxygenase-like cupin family protein
MVRPLTTSPSAAPRVRWREGVESRLHGDGATTICVLEQWIAPGAGAPTHVHHESEELILVLAGTVEFWSEGSAETLEEGASIVIPAGARHGFRNAGGGELHTIATFPTARPTVEYEREPGRIYDIGERHRRGEDAP